MDEGFTSGSPDAYVPEEAGADSQDLFTSPPEEAGAGFTALTVSDYGNIAVSSIPIGVLCGAIFMIVGLGIMVVVKIFKKV